MLCMFGGYGLRCTYSYNSLWVVSSGVFMYKCVLRSCMNVCGVIGVILANYKVLWYRLGVLEITQELVVVASVICMYQ